MILTNNWINAHFNGNAELESVFENRLAPSSAPRSRPGWRSIRSTTLMRPRARSSCLSTGAAMDDATEQLAAEADRTFDEGEAARELGDDYVLNTVFLAMVLFLATIADRFQWNAARAALLLFGLRCCCMACIT